MSGRLRESMPKAAVMVDELRAWAGREVIDALLLEAKRGGTCLYLAEIGEDGTLREFGASPSGGRCAIKSEGGVSVLVWVPGRAERVRP